MTSGLNCLRRIPLFSIAVILLLLVFGVFGKLLPGDPNALDLGASFIPPSFQPEASGLHLLGTDNLGRDVLTRIIAGTRISLLVALYAIVISGLIGTLVGMTAGYIGGRVDAVLMRLVDIQMSIPALALALVLAAVLGPGFRTVVIVVSVTYWPWYARIVRGDVLSLKTQGYIELARVAGCTTPTIFVRHLLPNIFNILLVLATLQVGQVIIFEAALSFLGLGIQQPDVSWGLMLADARGYIENAWWTITIPGVVIMLTCLAFNLLGDWLRDHLDPRAHKN